jgi:hypothetical protein
MAVADRRGIGASAAGWACSASTVGVLQLILALLLLLFKRLLGGREATRQEHVKTMRKTDLGSGSILYPVWTVTGKVSVAPVHVRGPHCTVGAQRLGVELPC